MPETRKSKAKRFAFLGFIAVALMVAILPLSAYGATAISGHGSAVIYEKSAAPISGYGNLKSGGFQTVSVAQATVNNTTTTILGNEYSTVGSNNTTVPNYYSAAYLMSNLTVSQLNSHSANKFVFEIKTASAGEISIGFGNVTNTSIEFFPIANGSFAAGGANYSEVSFNLTPQLLTSNGNLEYKVQFSNASAVPSYSVEAYAIGQNSAQPWYFLGQNMGYVLAIVTMLPLGFGVLPHHDTTIQKATEPVKRVVKGKKNTSKPKLKKTKKGGKR